MNENVIFVIGNPRSGTSLLRIMLHSHPSICIPPECGFIQWWHKKYSDWSVKDSFSQERIQDYLKDLKSSKKIETWQLNFNDLAKLIHSERPTNYSELSLLVIQQYAIQQNKQTVYFGDKNNYYIEHLDLILDLYPKARILHIVRDGRDVACSYLALNKLDSKSPYLPKLPSAIEHIAEEWIKNNKNIEDVLKQRNPILNFSVRYEDLIIESVKSLSAICKWLDLDYSEEMMNYTNAQAEPTATLDWKKKTTEKPDNNNIGKYKVELSQTDIQVFNNIAKEMLKHYAYEQ